MKKFLIAGALTGLLSLTSFANEVVLDMPLSDASKIADKSSAHNKGVLMGNSVLKDNAVKLDGDKSAIEVENSDALNIGRDDITIIAKIKLDSTQPERSGIVTKGAGSNTSAGYAFMYRVPKKALYFYVCNGTKRYGYQSKNAILNDGKWHTVAISLTRGKTVTFAVDGKIRGIRKDQLPAEDMVTSPAKLYIGSWGSYRHHCLKGEIKNVKVIKKGYSPEKLATKTE